MPQPTPARGGKSFSFARLRAAAIPELDLRYLGRVLLHAVLVGAVAGAVGTLFFVALEYAQRWILEGFVGYRPLQAAGEALAHRDVSQRFRPWLLVITPALGALAGGALTAFLAPEAQGGGGNAILHAFHQRNGVVRQRVPGVKFLASILTLGTGGSGGREGPTMQVGGAIGSLVGRYLGVPPGNGESSWWREWRPAWQRSFGRRWARPCLRSRFCTETTSNPTASSQLFSPVSSRTRS